MVSHPSTNRAQCWVTLLMWPVSSLLCQTTTVKWNSQLACSLAYAINANLICSHTRCFSSHFQVTVASNFRLPFVLETWSLVRPELFIPFNTVLSCLPQTSPQSNSFSLRQSTASDPNCHLYVPLLQTTFLVIKPIGSNPNKPHSSALFIISFTEIV